MGNRTKARPISCHCFHFEVKTNTIVENSLQHSEPNIFQQGHPLREKKTTKIFCTSVTSNPQPLCAMYRIFSMQEEILC